MGVKKVRVDSGAGNRYKTRSHTAGSCRGEFPSSVATGKAKLGKFVISFSVQPPGVLRWASTFRRREQDLSLVDVSTDS